MLCVQCGTKLKINDDKTSQHAAKFDCRNCSAKLEVQASSPTDADGFVLSSIRLRVDAAADELPGLERRSWIDEIEESGPTTQKAARPNPNANTASGGIEDPTARRTGARILRPVESHTPAPSKVRVTQDPGYLVLDFGTSYTQAFYLRMGEPCGYPKSDPKLSAIAYVDLSVRERPIYRIGESADALIRTNPESCAVSFKKLLGSSIDLHFKDPGGQTAVYKPDQVVRHFITGFLLEFAKETRTWPSQIFLTFPVNFTTAQRDLLREIVESSRKEASGDLEIVVQDGLRALRTELLMDEANAAAMNHVVTLMTEKPEAMRMLGGKWHLLVCDVGGGTTDIVLLEVNQRADDSDESSFEVVCKTVAPTGDYNFGGDIISAVVVDEIVAFLESQNLVVPVKPEGSSTTDAWRRNFTSLFRIATAVKHSLTSSDSVFVGNIAGQTMGAGSTLEALNTAGDAIPVTGDELARMMETYRIERTQISSRLEYRFALTRKMMNALLTKADIERADVVLLAGRGSSWPEYSKIASDFGKLIVLPENALKAKHAVSLGGWWTQYVNEGYFDLGSVEPAKPGTVCPATIGIAQKLPSSWRFSAAKDDEGRDAIAPGVPVPSTGVVGLVSKVKYPRHSVVIGRVYPGAEIEVIEEHVFIDSASDPKAVREALTRARKNHSERLRTLRHSVETTWSTISELVPWDVIDRIIEGVAPNGNDGENLKVIEVGIENLGKYVTELRRRMEEAALEAGEPFNDSVWRKVSRALRFDRAEDTEPTDGEKVASRADQLQIVVNDLQSDLAELMRRGLEISDLEKTRAALPSAGDAGAFKIQLDSDLNLHLSFIANDGRSVDAIRFGIPTQFFNDASVWRNGTDVLTGLGIARRSAP